MTRATTPNQTRSVVWYKMISLSGSSQSTRDLISALPFSAIIFFRGLVVGGNKIETCNMKYSRVSEDMAKTTGCVLGLDIQTGKCGPNCSSLCKTLISTDMMAVIQSTSNNVYRFHIVLVYCSHHLDCRGRLLWQQTMLPDHDVYVQHNPGICHLRYIMDCASRRLE